MIRLLTPDREADFLRFCESEPAGAVLTTRLAAYGLTDNHTMFWYAEDEKHDLTAVCGMMDGILLVCANEQTDRSELTAFSTVVGAREITYGEAAFRLCYHGGQSDEQTTIVTGENLRDIFSVIFENDPDRDAFFADWYTDASHKLRHGLIHGRSLYADGRCVSVALTSGETEKIAVISSVATREAYRGRGFASQVVRSLASSLPQTVYLMTNDQKTRDWYHSIGFKPI